MIYTIQNDHLTIQINDFGAELWSIQDNEQTEFLWQGDETYWKGRSPVLFPYVGRLTQNSYLYQNKKYSMKNHGFARNSLFSLVFQEKNKIQFSLKNSSETISQYPFLFEFFITYELHQNTLSIQYEVKNQSQETMFFGLGAHPGFSLPFTPHSKFEDYFLEFKNPSQPLQIGMNADCFRTKKEFSYPLTNNKIPLSHSLFDDDAIILKNISTTVSLKSRTSSKYISLSYPQMKYLGIWHKPKTKAPYLCIEPWISLPSFENEITDLKLQKDLISLDCSSSYLNQWSISIF